MPRGRRKYSKQRDATTKKISEDADINPEADGFYEDEVEQFHSKRNEQLTESVRRLEPVVSSEDDEDFSDEEDVLGLDVTDSEEECDEEYEKKILRKLGHRAVSSDEEESAVKPDGPSEKAWGKRKAVFYSTDYIDDELGGSGNEEAAEQEEIEAMALQKRMVAALDEKDFEVAQIHDVTATVNKPDKKQNDTNLEVVTRDLTKLSKEDKLEILAKEFPELFELLGDYKEQMSEVIEFQPLLKTARSHDILSSKAHEWLELKVHLTLCYCTNVAFYLLLKSHQSPVKTHPVIGQLVQYRKLLSQLELAGEEIEDEITTARELLAEEDGEQQLLSLHKDKDSSGVTKQQADNPKPVKVLRPKKRTVEEDPLSYYYKVKKSKEAKKAVSFSDEVLEEDNVAAGADTDGKRAITYQISRNKGLTPKRKKEQRNPRVKHRKKFRKAVIKRRSQVPDVVNEQVRYGGELTGIRANLSRSVKIK